jgi:hypothetical protein
VPPRGGWRAEVAGDRVHTSELTIPITPEGRNGSLSARPHRRAVTPRHRHHRPPATACAGRGEVIDVLAQLPAAPVLMVADLPTVIGNATGWLVGILAVLATFFLTLGGVRYMTAGGDPSEVERAKSALRSAGIGYALALLAPVLLTVLKQILGV